MDTRKRVVLVGTYRGDQLTKWRGWYNYPMGDGDGLAAKDAKAGFTQSPQRESESKGNLCASASLRETETSRTSCEKIPDWLPLVNELWLFDELIRDYGYPSGLAAKGKGAKGGRVSSRPANPHATHYFRCREEMVLPPWNFSPEPEGEHGRVSFFDIANCDIKRRTRRRIKP